MGALIGFWVLTLNGGRMDKRVGAFSNTPYHSIGGLEDKDFDSRVINGAEPERDNLFIRSGSQF